MTARWKFSGVLTFVVPVMLASGIARAATDNTNENEWGWREYEQSVQKKYEFEKWFGKTKSNYTHRVANWTPDVAGLGLGSNCVIGSRDENRYNYKFKSVGLRDASDTNAQVAVHIYECFSVKDAQRSLMQALVDSATCAYRLAGAGVNVGDRCYVVFTPYGDAIDFVRNNIRVEVTTFQTNGVPAVEIGRKLDVQILEASKKRRK